MRILMFRGSFSPNGEENYNGLICLCHIHKTDTDQTINTAVSKIAVHMNLREQVVVAPFSCLDEKNTTMYFDEANAFFKRFALKMPGTVFLPLKYSEIQLSVKPPNDFVKFIELE